ncbi:hypothetical protein Psta_2917 [Pirellula staleyi DSM 6068]|uniref:Pyrrolo-quinoline quinone repeat domain-containing protein n=1 Tax=Pirellula staleyi (strain ATCC 27377 / DSM 6068 / ICPB 4128) TaxID=530564 RepID=D2R8P1_PIRSD|nr:PQQ-binding-like beta-propeller repeat protein [Pirellula staleyi]ADB17582.1 hypothetical protein Psta_2917 [Pirellula staleyi DSM 6068]
MQATHFENSLARLLIRTPFCATRALGTLCFVALLVLGTQLWGQVFERPSGLPAAEIDEIDNQAATHLENARRFLATSQWEEAIDSIRRAADTTPDRLVLQPASSQQPTGFQLYYPVRSEAANRIAQLADDAPAALVLFRKLVDPLAANWLAEYRAPGQPEPLERILHEAFASRNADDALLLLGDYWLERDEPALARAYWQRISPLLTITPQAAALTKIPQGSAWGLARTKVLADKYAEFFRQVTSEKPRALPGTYPDTDIPLAQVRARLVLASLIELDLPRAEFELAMLRALDPETRGTIGGKTGPLAEILAGFVSAANKWPRRDSNVIWPTFAGNYARNGAGTIPLLSLDEPRWRFPLPRQTSDREVIGSGRLRPADDMKSLRSYHPIIVESQVLVRVDARGSSLITSLDIQTGTRNWQNEERRQHEAGVPDSEPTTTPTDVSDTHANLIRHFGVARFTLTAHRGIVYSRMGSPITGASSRRVNRLLAADQASLWGYDLTADGKPVDGFPIRPESSLWSFEGTPVVSDEGLFVLMRRVDGGRSQLYVAAFAHGSSPPPADGNAADFRPTGTLRWRTRLASSATLGNGDIDELSHHLLSLDGHQLFVNSGQGLIAALDSRSGKLSWMHRYPRSTFRSADADQSDDVFFRDLTPCLVHDSMVICAPSDCDRIFALDRLSGRMLWALPASLCRDAMHLLGVQGDYLLASGDWLYWIDTRTGTLASQFPAGSPGTAGDAAANPRGLGRGLIIGSQVYFPTRDSIYLFSTSPTRGPLGMIPQPLGEIILSQRGFSGGNLVQAGNSLLLVTGEELICFPLPLSPPDTMK